jgi:hypothetical protein
MSASAPKGGVQVFGLDNGIILAIPGGSIPNYLMKLVALLKHDHRACAGSADVDGTGCVENRLD